MKTKSIKYILAAGLVCCGLSTTMTSCNNVLDEQPREGGYRGRSDIALCSPALFLWQRLLSEHIGDRY